ncbi:hypothetical protein Hamer_G006570 [Homarus americanus]|uniref:Uncharacterized protein n=1 Tax=Homarus americanus TaxID=6706 RepID=A0A8J5MM58_HOMAM|nr:hypothetical protein Hamer_G006570 [Homarus americanus]
MLHNLTHLGFGERACAGMDIHNSYPKGGSRVLRTNQHSRPLDQSTLETSRPINSRDFWANQQSRPQDQSTLETSGPINTRDF